MSEFDRLLGNWIVNDYAGMLRKRRRQVQDWRPYAVVIRAWASGDITSTSARALLRTMYDREP